MARLLRLVLAAGVPMFTAACATWNDPPALPPGIPGAITPAPHADFLGTPASAATREVARWVVGTADNHGLGFVIVDKREARVFVFDAAGRLRGTSPVLLGSAPGDDSVEDIGKRPIAQVRPEERTTPAGRFMAETGLNAHGEDVVWVDYDAAVSMHRLRAVNAAERRQERLASPASDDNRISYGCINVPADFYEHIVRPLFSSGRGLVYVLPEVKSLRQVFGWQAPHDPVPRRNAALRESGRLP